MSALAIFIIIYLDYFLPSRNSLTKFCFRLMLSLFSLPSSLSGRLHGAQLVCDNRTELDLLSHILHDVAHFAGKWMVEILVRVCLDA